MNLSRFLRGHQDKAKKLVKELDAYSPEMRVSKVLSLMENAFSEGAVSMVKAKKLSTSKKEAANFLESSTATGYLKDNIGVIIESLLSVISDISDNGRLTASWKEISSEEFIEIVYTIYDLGFLSGMNISQDPVAYNLYLNNREELYESTRK